MALAQKKNAVTPQGGNRPEGIAAPPAATSPALAVLVSTSELILKGKNRRYFEQKLLQNIRTSLGSDISFRYERVGASFLFHFPQPVDEKTVERLQRVFGIASLAPVVASGPTFEELSAAVLATFPQGFSGSFAVESRRTDKKFPLNSRQINESLGRVLQEAYALPVNLDRPDLTLKIQVMADRIYFSWHQFSGRRGLPVGVSGKVVVLLSGGIDSPVAAYQMASRGCHPVYVHFHSAPYTNRASIDKTMELVTLLERFHGATKLYLVPFAPLQQEIIRCCPEPLRVILYRRFMVRIASRIASYEGALALVTGESVGQVASQTLANIRSIEAVTPLPILRPLIGIDKQEITARAREIGTYAVSIEPDQDCCSYLMPSNPATHTQLLELEMAESAFELERLVRQTLQATECWSGGRHQSPFHREK